MGAPAQAPRPLVVYRGDTLRVVVKNREADGVTPVDITGRSYAMQIRSHAASPTIVATPTCAVIDGPNGVLIITLPASTTATLPVCRAVADLEETSASTVTTLVRWDVLIVSDVTRSGS